METPLKTVVECPKPLPEATKNPTESRASIEKEIPKPDPVLETPTKQQLFASPAKASAGQG